MDAKPGIDPNDQNEEVPGPVADCPPAGLPYDYAVATLWSVPTMSRNHFGEEYYLPSRWENGSAQATSHWTPDGSAIVFGHQGRMYVVDANGSELRSLSGSFEPAGSNSQGNDIDFSPSLSPDGCRVAYTTLRFAEGTIRQHTYEIATQATDGSDRRRLTSNIWNDVSPAWSPDGTRIAFVSHREDGPRIFTMTPDGSDERNVAPSVQAQTGVPLWSPDGGRLAFVAEEKHQVTIGTGVDAISTAVPREALYTVALDGTGLAELAWSSPSAAPAQPRRGGSDSYSSEEDVRFVQWSPDGGRIAFVAHRYGELAGVYVADGDGSAVRQVFHLSAIDRTVGDYPGRILGIAWSSDSSRIHFEVGIHLGYHGRPHAFASAYSVAADGSDLRLRVHWAEHKRYLPWEERLVGTGPARIVRYTDRLNVPPETGGWVLSTIPWGSSDEKVLVRVVGGRVVPGDPPQADAADDAGRCADGHVVPAPDQNPGLVDDCRALLGIREALAGDEVLYWSAGSPIQEWPGIAVGGSPPRVHTLVSVPGVQLTGTIPPGISELTRLRVLNLEGNALGGTLPPELGDLRDLEVLDVGDWWGGHNHFTGSIPAQLGNLEGLKVLDLSGNGFEGLIPRELGQLSNLQELYLGDNPLEGSIPPELGALGELRVLYLGGNRSRLTGTIPPELGDLGNLRVLKINWTELSGSIPPELGNLSHLQELALRGNPYTEGGLTGAIPPELAGLRRVQTLRLEHNRLEGPIPPELGDLVEETETGYRTWLRYLDLSDNLLTGCVPARLERVWSIRVDLPFCE